MNRITKYKKLSYLVGLSLILSGTLTIREVKLETQQEEMMQDLKNDLENEKSQREQLEKDIEFLSLESFAGISNLLHRNIIFDFSYNTLVIQKRNELEEPISSEIYHALNQLIADHEITSLYLINLDDEVDFYELHFENLESLSCKSCTEKFPLYQFSTEDIIYYTFYDNCFSKEMWERFTFHLDEKGKSNMRIFVKGEDEATKKQLKQMADSHLSMDHLRVWTLQYDPTILQVFGDIPANTISIENFEVLGNEADINIKCHPLTTNFFMTVNFDEDLLILKKLTIDAKPETAVSISYFLNQRFLFQFPDDAIVSLPDNGNFAIWPLRFTDSLFQKVGNLGSFSTLLDNYPGRDHYLDIDYRKEEGISLEEYVQRLLQDQSYQKVK